MKLKPIDKSFKLQYLIVYCVTSIINIINIVRTKTMKLIMEQIQSPIKQI